MTWAATSLRRIMTYFIKDAEIPERCLRINVQAPALDRNIAEAAEQWNQTEARTTPLECGWPPALPPLSCSFVSTWKPCSF